ncbi:MAG: class I SAM-dependent methyltransferase [Candidatus Omnitrophota bacterium]|nr:class I SAM-dependent methyltransferase [Candidatus Omnitrophota bacterium]
MASVIEHKELEFTGEAYIPGKTPLRIALDHVARYRFAAKYAKDRNVLDVACGEGYGSQRLLDAGAKSVTGVDLSGELIAHAAKKYTRGPLRFIKADISFYAAAPFDVIACFETIEHVPDFQGAIKNLYRLLKPGGVLIISSPNRPVTSPARSFEDRPCNRFHSQEFTIPEMRALLEDHGFHTESSAVFGQRLTGHNAAAHFVWKYLSPAYFANPFVRKISNQTPRYFVLVARKPRSESLPEIPGDNGAV